MSKEKLEEIKEKYGLTDTDKLRAIYVSMAIKTEDLIWFKQQAEEKIQLEERVKELENQLEVTGNELSLVSQENQRYKQALEEIVNIDGRFTAMDEDFDYVIAYDWVDEIARESLKREAVPMTKRLAPEQLAQIRERVDKATRGDWKFAPIGGTLDYFVKAEDGDRGVARAYMLSDANFIAHAREDIPNLLAHIEKQSEEIRYHKGYADRYSEIIAEQKAEIEELSRNLANACRDHDRLDSELYDAYTELMRGKKGRALAIIEEVGADRYDET